MTIIRSVHDKNNPYVVLNKSALEDSNLSWAAKGLWSYLMGKPDNWNISVSHLSTIYNERGGNEKAIYALLNELIQSGYCQRNILKNEKGQFQKTEYIVLELKNKVPLGGSRDAVHPRPGKRPPTNNDLKNNDKKFVYQKNDKIKNDQNVPLSSPIDIQNSNVSFSASEEKEELHIFDPKKYQLKNGRPLSSRTQATFTVYMKNHESRSKLMRSIQYYEAYNTSKVQNHEAFLQNCFNNDYGIELDYIWQNDLYAQMFKEEYKIKDMEILKTVIQLNQSKSGNTISISKKLHPNTFADNLENYMRTI